MQLVAPARLAVLICTGLLAIGCGGGESDEVELGAETVPSRVESNSERIRKLERRLERRRARTDAAGGRTAPAGRASTGLIDAAAFDQLAASLGEVGVAVGPVGAAPADQLGSLRSGAAWSTIKVPIAAATVLDAGGADAVSATDQDLIRRAITASDNAAAAALWDGLAARYGGPEGAAAAVGQVLAEAGDGGTAVSTVGRDGFSPYGQTDWSLAGQQRFMARFAAGCAAAAAQPAIWPLLGEIVADQRWGLGSTGAPAYFKGGWGPGTDGRYLVRQMGVVEQGDAAIAVALAVVPPDGQLATGTAALSQLAQWVVENVDWSRARPRGC